MEEELYLCEPLNLHYIDFAIEPPGDMTGGSTIPAGIPGGYSLYSDDRDDYHFLGVVQAKSIKITKLV